MRFLRPLIALGALVLPVAVQAQVAVPGALDRAFASVNGAQGSGMSPVRWIVSAMTEGAKGPMVVTPRTRMLRPGW